MSNAVPAAETPTPQPTDTALPGAVSLSASPGGTQVRLPLIYRRWPPLLSKEEAIQILLDQVKPATLDHDLLAFGLPEPLWPGDSVRPYLENGAAPMAISLSAPHWFFWVDDAPGAFFEHPTRYVLIDAYHGGISLQGEVWPPVVNEKPLWADAAQYWSPSHWVYYRLSEVPGQGYAELLISDTGNNRVLGCDIHGNIHFEIRGLNRPSDAEYGPLGQILIADTGNNRVLLTDRLGHIFRTIPAQDPIDVEWDPYLQDIYIVERSASRIVRLDGLDRVTWQATSVGGYALARPYDMEAGHFGLSLLANTGADELLAVHSRDGLRRLSDLSDGTVMVSPVDAEVLPNGHLLVTYSAGGHASRHGGAGADLLAGGDHVAEINADGAITFSAGGWQDAHDAEPFIAGDVLIVETGKSRVVRVDRFGHVLQEVHRLSDGSRLSAPLDVEVLVTPYRPNAPYIEPEGVGCPAMQDPPPGERECALVVNGIVQGEHLLGTAELDTQDMAAFFRCLGIQETVRVTSSLQAKAIMLATLDQMAQRCDDIVLVLEGHGASAKTRRDPTIRVGGSSLTLPELQAALRKHPNVDFKIVLESCYSGRWQEGLAGLENVKKVITSSDANYPSYGDMDAAADPNPEDQGSEFL
ncbi:MAG: hypothetical protein FJZ90_15465, partial [Chloroflexi bacterium]|nr:hypothetical protein [Chloroflexota bacterium]